MSQHWVTMGSNNQGPCSRKDCVSEAVREASDRQTNEQIIADGEDNTPWWCNQEWLLHGRSLGRGDISSETWQGGANHHASLTVGISLKDVVSRQSDMRLVEWEGSSEDKDSLLPCRTGSSYPSWQHGAQGSRVLCLKFCDSSEGLYLHFTFSVLLPSNSQWFLPLSNRHLERFIPNSSWKHNITHERLIKQGCYLVFRPW